MTTKSSLCPYNLFNRLKEHKTKYRYGRFESSDVTQHTSDTGYNINVKKSWTNENKL